jgi:4,5-DOPA dioxygenase extradiol
MFALEHGTSAPALRAFAASLTPLFAAHSARRVLVMSPHWMTRQPVVMRNPKPSTWHDFGGFPPELYQLQYPAPSSIELADQVLSLLNQAGISAAIDSQRPFDHGAWVPLMHLWPQADVEVVQLAMPANDSLLDLYRMGLALSSLRAQGVLIVGSGSMTHNLGEFFIDGRPELHDPAKAYVLEFANWMQDALQHGDLAALLNYRQLAPHALRAHPTDDHLRPLFFALGASGIAPEALLNQSVQPWQTQVITREVMYGILSMCSLAFSA